MKGKATGKVGMMLLKTSVAGKHPDEKLLPGLMTTRHATTFIPTCWPWTKIGVAHFGVEGCDEGVTIRYLGEGVVRYVTHEPNKICYKVFLNWLFCINLIVRDFETRLLF